MLSQWIPMPFPISRHSLSCSSLAFLNLGNHNNGTPNSLPSWRCTKSISLLNQTLDARTCVDLFAKVLIPFIPRYLMSLLIFQHNAYTGTYLPLFHNFSFHRLVSIFQKIQLINDKQKDSNRLSFSYILKSWLKQKLA